MIESIYAFGSICRGELDVSSDIDLLVITENGQHDSLNKNFSYYKKRTLEKLWNEGNPFAWHLHMESKIIYSIDGNNYIKELGKPNSYNNLIKDLDYLLSIFLDAKESIIINDESIVFDFSTIFLVIRNVATCYDLGNNNNFCFQRDSPLNISDKKLDIGDLEYNTLRNSRLLSTRGIGKTPSHEEVELTKKSISIIEEWICLILKESNYYEPV